MSVISTVQECACCGAKEFSTRKVLWESLIQQWQLGEHEVDYINRQQGLQCEVCGSNLRSMALALAICRCYGYGGTLKQFIEEDASRRLRVLELNEAGNLTQFLSKLPGHTLARYPEVDMMRMPYQDGSFDLIVHSDTLEHVPQPVTALSECYRVLAPGGFCAFTIPVVVDRLTRSRTGLPASYHGHPDEHSEDWSVQTEYGCDAWKQVIFAGFQECRLITQEFPSAMAFVGVRATHELNAGNRIGQTHPVVAERMVPESADTNTFWEHVYRYAFASRFVKNKRVLDIACGEGYGAAALKQAGAAHVIGVDISELACIHARTKYNIETKPGSAEKIPLPDRSVDVVVSFETIEHVPHPESFLDECLRVLVPGGRLVISTPRQGVFQEVNPYHCSELTEAEFTSALRSRFQECRFYTQRPISVAWWSTRSFACDDTPWKHIRGFSRLRRAIQSRFVREAIHAPTREQRASILNLIAKTEARTWALCNPFVLRPRRSGNGEKPTYFIATATR